MTIGYCAKRRVQCTIYATNGREYTGENLCAKPQPVCPRQPGDDYSLCRIVCRQIGHAEEVALAVAGDDADGAVAIVQGHTRICQSCRDALQEAGVTTAYIAQDNGAPTPAPTPTP